MRYDTTVTKETPAAIAEPINSLNEGLFNEMRDRTFFQSRGEKRRLAKAAGRRRWLKKVEKKTEAPKIKLPKLKKMTNEVGV